MGPKVGSPSSRLACKLRSRAEFLQEFFAQTIKAANGHNEKMIAWSGFRPQMFCNGVGAGQHACVLAQGAHTFCNGFAVTTILAAELLGAKTTADTHAFAE